MESEAGGGGEGEVDVDMLSFASDGFAGLGPASLTLWGRAVRPTAWRHGCLSELMAASLQASVPNCSVPAGETGLYWTGPVISSSMKQRNILAVPATPESSLSLSLFFYLLSGIRIFFPGSSV